MLKRFRKKIKKIYRKVFSREQVVTTSYRLPSHKEQRVALFVNTYIELGVSGLITLINQDPLVSMLDKAKYYLEASGSVKEYNVYDAYLLSRIGNDLYPDEFTYRALAWRAKQANEILVAKQCMDWLLVYYDKNGISNEYKESVDNLFEQISKKLEKKSHLLVGYSSIEGSMLRERMGFQEIDNNKVITLTMLLHMYRFYDEQHIINCISQNERTVNTDKSFLCIQLSKYFRERKRYDSSLLFAKKAMEFDDSPLAFNNLYWAYKISGRLSESFSVIQSLKSKLLEHNISDKNSLISLIEKLEKDYKPVINFDKVKAVLFDIKNEYPNYEPIKNRIVYVLHNSLPYASGGYATRSHGMAKGLKNNGFDIISVSRPGFPYDTKPELENALLSDSELVDDIEYVKIHHPRRIKGRYRADIFMLESADALLQKCLELKPEIIIAASAYQSATPALIVAKKLGVPFIYEVRGFWEITRLSREPEFEHSEVFQNIVEIESITVSSADYVFTLTQAMQEELLKRGANADKIMLLPNSCMPEQFILREKDDFLIKELNFPSDVPVIGYIGTFVFYEGLELLAEACGQLKNQGIQFRLLLVGNENTAGNNRGSIMENINQIAKRYGFEDWLIMPGRIPFEKVESYYSLIDIAPFPRLPLPVCELVSPMKPLEALAMEKAIVVSSVGALSEMVVPEQTGLIFRKGDVNDLIEKLKMLINNKELRTRLGKNGRVWVENERTWDKTSEKASQVIRAILNKNGE